MFNNDTSVMLYVQDTQAEKNFWEAIGFSIIREEEIMGHLSFDMKPSPTADLTLTVFNLDFIRQVSPEVANNQPSILFKTEDIDRLHQKVSAVTETTSPIQEQPFRNFNFASPSGHYYAVAEII